MSKVLLLAFLAFVGVCYSQVNIGVAVIQGTTENSTVSGFVAFTLNPDNTVTVLVNVTGIEPASANHGIHVHEFGDLLNVTSVGSHWNPLNSSHGCPPNTTRHLGDTGNWMADADGTILSTKNLDLLVLTGSNSIIGHAVVIHGGVDDCISTGSSASRIGFGVIGIVNPSTVGAASNSAVYGGSSSIAVCHLTPIGGSGVTGTVYFKQESDSSTTVSAMVEGLENGSIHGFHVHEYGDLSDMTAGLSVGGHYNPYNNSHALPGYTNVIPHVGDLGNIKYYENGVAYYKYTNTNKMVVNGLNNIVGRAVVVHAKEDNCTMPSAAGRIAFCVIGVSNGEFTTVTVPAATPLTQDSSKCELVYPDTTTTGVSTTGENSASAVAASFLVVASLIVLLF